MGLLMLLGGIGAVVLMTRESKPKGETVDNSKFVGTATQTKAPRASMVSRPMIGVKTAPGPSGDEPKAVRPLIANTTKGDVEPGSGRPSFEVEGATYTPPRSSTVRVGRKIYRISKDGMVEAPELNVFHAGVGL